MKLATRPSTFSLFSHRRRTAKQLRKAIEWRNYCRWAFEVNPCNANHGAVRDAEDVVLFAEADFQEWR